MGFVDEIKNDLTFDKDDVNCTLSFFKGITVEGYKKILELSESRVVLLCKNALKIQILGSNFCIEEIAHEEICLSGNVDSIMKI